MEKKTSPKKKRIETSDEKKEEIAEVVEAKDDVQLEKTVAVEAAINVPSDWKPKTKIGKMVMEGKLRNIDDIFENGWKITEPQIADALLSNLQNDIILIGGSGGKGGGVKRIVSRRTTRMHKSGRRFRTSAMIVVGNSNGYVGIGMGSGPARGHREVMNKALSKAKTSIVPVRRGCGSWECKCGGAHSIPFAVTGKSGSVHVQLIPAPKGVGLCVNDDVKKLMRLAGIKDIWCQTRGQTSTRLNALKAFVDALSKLNRFKIREDYEKATGMRTGRAD